MSLLQAKYISALYSGFRLMPPFDRYDLPPAGKIEWKIINDPAAYGYFHCDPNLRDRKSTRLNSSHSQQSRMPSSA